MYRILWMGPRNESDKPVALWYQRRTFSPQPVSRMTIAPERKNTRNEFGGVSPQKLNWEKINKARTKSSKKKVTSFSPNQWIGSRMASSWITSNHSESGSSDLVYNHPETKYVKQKFLKDSETGSGLMRKINAAKARQSGPKQPVPKSSKFINQLNSNTTPRSQLSMHSPRNRRI